MGGPVSVGVSSVSVPDGFSMRDKKSDSVAKGAVRLSREKGCRWKTALEWARCKGGLWSSCSVVVLLQRKLAASAPHVQAPLMVTAGVLFVGERGRLRT